MPPFFFRHMDREYNIWTDGSCNNNSKHHSYGVGGWAFVVEKSDKVIYEDLGYEANTSSNRMEMTAVIKSLEWAVKNKPKARLVIHSDSAYVVNCFLERWYLRWIEMDWDDVKNSDLWKKLLALYDSKLLRVKFKKVAGHKGIKNNERADFLAGMARKYAMENLL
jgi:ribonuclease HI